MKEIITFFNPNRKKSIYKTTQYNLAVAEENLEVGYPFNHLKTVQLFLMDKNVLLSI